MINVSYVRVLREGWLIVLAAMLVCVAAAYGIARSLPTEYAASSTLLLKVDSPDASAFERNQFSLARIKSYPTLVDNPDVIAGVRQDLALDEADYSDKELRAALSAVNPEGTVLLVVTATASAATPAAEMANSAAVRLSQLIEGIENTPDDRYELTLDQVLPATAPTTPQSPNTTVILALGALIGLSAGAIAALLRSLLRRRVASLTDVVRDGGMPVVAQVPVRQQRSEKARLSTAGRFDEAVANLALLGGDLSRGFAVVQLSSDKRLDGALDAVSEAAARARAGAVVIDLRSSKNPVEGQATVETLVDAVQLADLDHVLRRDGVDSDSVIRFTGSGALDQQSLAAALPRVLDAVRERGFVTLGALDLHSIAVAKPWVDAGGDVLVALAQGRTRSVDLAGASSRLSRLGVRPLGVLLVGRRGLGGAPVSTTWGLDTRTRADAGARTQGSPNDVYNLG
ncbi:hypothetical protein [Microbacterium lacticum]